MRVQPPPLRVPTWIDDVLADHVVGADHELGGLAREALVLRLLAEHREREDARALADRACGP